MTTKAIDPKQIDEHIHGSEAQATSDSDTQSIELVKESTTVIQPKVIITKDVRETIHSSLDQIVEYYEINKRQARSSFVIAATSFFIGLLMMVAGVSLYYIRGAESIQIATITVIGGLFSEFISGTFTFLYRKSQYQLNHFLSTLTTLQETMLAVTLCDEIKTDEKRDNVKEYIIKALVPQRSSGKQTSSARETLVHSAASVVGGTSVPPKIDSK